MLKAILWGNKELNEIVQDKHPVLTGLGENGGFPSWKYVSGLVGFVQASNNLIISAFYLQTSLNILQNLKLAWWDLTTG